jgi:hypothetical protein
MSEPNLLSPSPRRRFLVEWQDARRIHRRYFVHMKPAQKRCAAHLGAVLWRPCRTGWTLREN